MRIMEDEEQDIGRVFHLRLGKRHYVYVASLSWIEDGYLTKPVFHMSRSFFGIGVYRVVFFVSIMRYTIEVEK